MLMGSNLIKEILYDFSPCFFLNFIIIFLILSSSKYKTTRKPGLNKEFAKIILKPMKIQS
jgi:hypothetical protein